MKEIMDKINLTVTNKSLDCDAETFVPFLAFSAKLNVESVYDAKLMLGESALCEAIGRELLTKLLANGLK